MPRCCRACSRQKRRPTILDAEGAISWPTLGGEAAPGDAAAAAAKPQPLTFPQEMARFADKARLTQCSSLCDVHHAGVTARVASSTVMGACL